MFWKFSSSEFVESRESKLPCVVSLITSLCKASDEHTEVEVEGGVISCSVLLSTSGLEDGTTGKLTGIRYGIWDILNGIRVELRTFSFDLLKK